MVGIRYVGMPPRLVCGLLSGVPVGEYVGGDGVLAGGDVTWHTVGKPKTWDEIQGDQEVER